MLQLCQSGRVSNHAMMNFRARPANQVYMNKPLQPGSEEHAGGPPTKWPARIGLSRHSAVGFLVTLILLFIINPFIEFMRNGVLVESVVVTLVLVWGVLAVGKRRRTLVLGILFAIPPIMGKWANHFRPDLVSNEVFLIAGLFYILFVIVHSLAFILRAPNVNSEVLCAGLSTYLLLGLLWCFAYRLASVIDSHAISDHRSRIQSDADRVRGALL